MKKASGSPTTGVSSSQSSSTDKPAERAKNVTEEKTAPQPASTGSKEAAASSPIIQPSVEAKPKRAPLNVEEFWKYESSLPVNQRRARYVCDYFLGLDDIPTWASDSAILELADREESIKKLKKSFQQYDDAISKATIRQEQRAELMAKIQSKKEARSKRKAEKKQSEGEKPDKAEDDTDSDSDDSSSESSDSEDAELSQESRKKAKRARMLLMMEPEPDPADLVPYVDSEKFAYQPNEEINRKISLWQGDITTLEIDAIVNAANEGLRGGGGIDGAIHSAAGPTLLDECILLNGATTGQTKITRGHRLPAKFILHTVGPQVGSTAKPLPRSKLESCYRTCLELADKHGIRSLAFCSISTGIFSYPMDMATHTALSTVRNWLENPENLAKIDRVIFCVFSDKDRDVYEEMMPIYFPPQAESEIVKLPCADAERWAHITEALRQPIGKVEQLSEYFQQVSGRKDDVSGLSSYLLETMPRKDSTAMLKKEFTKIAELALKLPELFKRESPDSKEASSESSNSIVLDLSNLRLLVHGLSQSVKLSQEQVASLLACAFFGILTPQSFHGQAFVDPNLFDVFGAIHVPEGDEVQAERAKKNQFVKIQCLLHYFRRVISALPNEHELIFRRKVLEEPSPDWRHGGEERIVDAHDFPTSQLVHCSTAGEIQLLAASRLPSTGVRDPSPQASRSDLRWFVNPELFIVSLLCPELLSNEAIEVRGFETFCDCSVDSDGVMYFKDDHVDNTETDEGVRRSRVVLVDPVVEKDQQLYLRPYNIFKDLNKLYVALHEPVAPVAKPAEDPSHKKKVEKDKEFEIAGKPPAIHVATDDWGCDFRFQGEPYLRAVQCLLAITAFNNVNAAAPEKYVVKQAIEKRPELFFHQSVAGSDLLKLVQTLHHEQVPLKYVTRMLLGKISRDPKAGVELPTIATEVKGLPAVSDPTNLCARLTVLFRNWKKELKRMKEEQERKRREDDKRRQREMEEWKKRQKAQQKEFEKQKKLKEKEKELADHQKDKEKEKEPEDKKKEKELAADASPKMKPKSKTAKDAGDETQDEKAPKKSSSQLDSDAVANAVATVDAADDADAKKKKRSKKEADPAV